MRFGLAGHLRHTSADTESELDHAMIQRAFSVSHIHAFFFNYLFANNPHQDFFALPTQADGS